MDKFSVLIEPIQNGLTQFFVSLHFFEKSIFELFREMTYHHLKNIVFRHFGSKILLCYIRSIKLRGKQRGE